MSGQGTGNLISALAGIAGGFAGYENAKEKKKRQKEQDQLAKDQRDAAATQQRIDNTFKERELNTREEMANTAAKREQDQIKIAEIKANGAIRIANAKSDDEAYKLAQELAKQTVQPGQDPVQLAMYYMSSRRMGQPAQPGLQAPTSPVQSPNPAAGTNAPPPAVDPLTGRPSVIQAPQLQPGQAPGAGMPGGFGTLGPNSVLGSKIAQQQGSAANSLSHVPVNDAMAADLKSQTALRDSQKLLDDFKLKMEQQKLPLEISNMKLKNQVEEKSIALFKERIDNEHAVAMIHAAQAQVAANLAKYEVQLKQNEAASKGLDVVLKKLQVKDYGTYGMDKKDAAKAYADASRLSHEASTQKEKVISDIATTQHSLAARDAMLAMPRDPNTGLIPNPFPGNKAIDAMNQSIGKDGGKALSDRAADLKKLKQLQTMLTDLDYQQAQADYVTAKTVIVNRGSGKDDKAQTEQSISTAKRNYDAALKAKQASDAKKQPKASGSVPPATVSGIAPADLKKLKHYSDKNSGGKEKKIQQLFEDYMKEKGLTGYDH